MFYLGIDIAKNTHVASLMDEKGKTIFKGFSFSNTIEGGKSILEIVKKHTDFSNVVVGMEATGHYWLSIYSFLYDYNFNSIHVINPIQTDGWRKGSEIRKRKIQCNPHQNTNPILHLILAERLDGSIGKLLPAFALMTRSLMGTNGKGGVEQQYSLFSPAGQIARGWHRSAEIHLNLLEYINQ